MGAAVNHVGWVAQLVDFAGRVSPNTGHGIEISVANTDQPDGSNIANITVKTLPGYTREQLTTIGTNSDKMMREVHKVHQKANPRTNALLAIGGVALLALGSAIGFSMNTTNFNLFPQDNPTPQPSQPSFGSMAIVFTGLAAVTGIGTAVGTYCYNNWTRFTNWLSGTDERPARPAIVANQNNQNNQAGGNQQPEPAVDANQNNQNNQAGANNQV